MTDAPDEDPPLTIDPVRAAYLAAEERQKKRSRMPNFGWNRGALAALQVLHKGNTNQPVDDDQA